MVIVRSLPVTIRLRLLHGFSLTRDGVPVDLSRSDQRLLAFLALHREPQLRTFVAATLWPDRDENRARGNLRSAIWRLQRSDLEVLEANRTHVALAPRVTVDGREMAALAVRLLELPSPQFDPTAVDEAAMFGELLPGWYDEWVVAERERMRQLQLHSLEALCVRLLACGDHARAIQVALAATAAEPLRESAHRALIRAHLAEGNVGEAVRQYEAYRSLLAAELGVEPSPAIKRLLWSGGLEDSA